MTKQQQQKIDKVNQALELMENGATLSEASNVVGYSRSDKLRRALRELDFIEYKGKWIKIDDVGNTRNTRNTEKKSNTKCNTECNTLKNEVVLVESNPLALPEVIDLLEAEQDTLKDMIQWYKAFSNTGNTSNTVMKVELPESENIMISTRSNKVVWEQFKEFAKGHSAHFKMGDLVAQALLDYINKNK